MAILTRETTATGVTNNNAPLTNAELDNNFVELVADIADKVALTDLSVTTNAAGTASLSYSNSTGTFTYTPPDLSGYQTSAALNEDIDDRVAALLQAGNGIALDYDDVNNELAISSEVTEITAYNGTGSTLTKGTVVYQSGVQGLNISVAAASNSAASTMPAVGIVISDIANAATGQIAVAGLVRNLDTSSFTAGDVLYVGTSGALTATKPTGESNLIQNFGRALKINASSGEVLVLGAGRTNDVPNLADGNVFIGNASNVAEKRALAAGDIASGTFADARIAQSNVTQHQAALSITESQISDFGTYLTTVALNDVSDVVITSLSSGQILKYNGTNWVNDTDAGGIALTDLSVTTNSAGTAALSYNNTNGVFSYTPPDLSGYLTSYTETDPVVGAITGIVKADGAGNISAAVAGTDYLTSYTETDTLDSVTGRGATTTNNISVGDITADQSLTLANGAKVTVSTGNSAFTDFLGGSTNNTSDDGLFAFYGGRAYNQGAGVILYGDDHATWPNVISFRNGSWVERFAIQADGTASFKNGIEEAQYSLTGTAIDPANGTIQYKTLAANTTFTESLADGEFVTLMIDDGSAYTVTWPTTTWVGGSAPTLGTTGYNVIHLWHINGVLYGAFIGTA